MFQWSLSPQYHNVTVAESIPVGRVILEIQATDTDEPDTGSSYIIYQVEEGDPNHKFIIETDPETNRGFVKINKVNRWVSSLLSLSTCTFVIYTAHCSGTPILLTLLSSTYPLLLAPALGSGRWRSSLCIVGKKLHYFSDADFPSCWWSGPLVVFATKCKWNSLVSVPVQQGSLFLLRPTLTVTKPRSVCAEVGDKSHVLSVGIRNTRYVFHCIHVFQYQKGSPFEISLLGGMWTTGLEKWSLVFQRVTRSLHQVHVPLAMGSDQWIIFGLILSIIFSWRCNCEKLRGVTTLASNSVSQRSSKAF